MLMVGFRFNKSCSFQLYCDNKDYPLGYFLPGCCITCLTYVQICCNKDKLLNI